MHPQDWNRYCRANPELLASRRQSVAFLAAYGLVPLPLLPHSKIAMTGPPPKFDDWLDIDHPDSRNWAAAIPRVTPTTVWVDADTDVRPLGTTTPWTDELLTEAQQYQRVVSDALDTFGVSCHRFGRDSLNNLGHAILPVNLNAPGLRQTPLELLDMLGMRRPVRIGNLSVRIEIRRASTGRMTIPRSITLPGSTYEGLTQPLDLIRWYAEADFPEGRTWTQTLAPQPLHSLRMALYAALLALGVLNLWVRGDRHHMALIVSGALAHERGAGFLGNDEARDDDAAQIFDFVLRMTGDPDPRDRRRVFEDTQRAFDAGRPVTGYATLREVIGDDLGKALLHMRGGSDPDAIAAMFSNAVYIERDDRWLWLPDGSRLLKPRNNQEMQRLLREHPAYPSIPRQGRAGNVHLVDVVLTSPRKQRAREMVSFPGIDFAVRYTWQDGDYVPLGEDEPIESCDAINISAGFATRALPEGEVPDEAIYARALGYWKRHRAWLTQDDPLQNRKLDQLIALKIQFPRIKYQLGCALVGGQGIGKSALFNVVLRAVVGPELIGHSSRAEMEGEFRYRQLDKSLFYVLEELRLGNARPEVQESFKDLMRNQNIERNRKYGAQDICRNVAIPFVVSNEKNPSLLVDGVPDRALVIIYGHSQESLRCTTEEWTQHKAQVRDEVAEFAEALKDPTICESLFHFWATLDIDPRIFDDTESESVSPADVLLSRPPIEQAILDMLSSGAIFPGRDGNRGPSIDEPFPLEGVAEALALRIRKPVSVTEAGNAFASLFMDGRNNSNRTIERGDRDKMLCAKRWKPEGEERRYYYYLRKRRGEISLWLRDFRNIELDLNREMDQAFDFGETPEPSKEVLERAWKRWSDLGVTPGLRSP